MVDRTSLLLRLPKEMMQSVVVQADKSNVSRSEWIRQAVKERLERIDLTAEEVAERSEATVMPHRRNTWWD